MRLTLQRGTALIAVIAGLGAGLMSATPLATAGEEEGREFMQAGEYDKAVQELQPLADQGSPTAEYLLGTPLLGDFLESGFNDLGYSCEDIEEEHL